MRESGITTFSITTEFLCVFLQHSMFGFDKYWYSIQKIIQLKTPIHEKHDPTKDNDKDLSQYDSGCSVGHITQTLTFVYSVVNLAIQLTLCGMLMHAYADYKTHSKSK